MVVARDASAKSFPRHDRKLLGILALQVKFRVCRIVVLDSDDPVLGKWRARKPRTKFGRPEGRK